MEKRHNAVLNEVQTDVPGVNLNRAVQEKWLRSVEGFYKELPYDEEPVVGYRYHYNNEAFVYTDAIFLFGILRTLRPKRIVEIGSGYSSAIMLDVNETYLNGQVAMTFIEPYPDRLNRLLKATDTSSATIIDKRLQDVETAPWNQLKENDILFIDSSHVSKCGSDVNQLFFEILPSLSPGVVVHVHDVFPRFEYPLSWLKRGWYWNEDYLLRSFLMFNDAFEILIWPSLLLGLDAERTAKLMPLCLKNTGSSFYMRRRLTDATQI